MHQRYHAILDIITSWQLKAAIVTFCSCALIWGVLASAIEVAHIEKELSTKQFLWAILFHIYESRIYFFSLLEVNSFTFYNLVTTLQGVVFGNISEEEAQNVHNMSLSYIFFKLVMITSLLDQWWPECYVWVVWFCVSLAGKSFFCLGSTRYKNLVAQGLVDSRIIKRQLIALSIVFLFSFFWTLLPYYLFYSQTGLHPLLLFLFDGCQNLVQGAVLIANYCLYLSSIENPESWPQRDSYNHGVQLIGVCMVECFHILNLIYIWTFGFLTWSFLDLVLTQYLLSAYFKLTGAIRNHRDYFNVIHDINNKYPDATPEEIGDDCNCAICQEKIERGKKLPCGHIFHLKCLQDWMRYRQICPMCRTELTSDRSRNQNAQNVRGGSWGFGFDFSSFQFQIRRTTNSDFAELNRQVQTLSEAFPDENREQLRADLIRFQSMQIVANQLMMRNNPG